MTPQQIELAKRFGIYLLQALIVFFFLVPGIMKLTSRPEMMLIFYELGYPFWFMYVVGVVEVVGSLSVAFGGYIDKRITGYAIVGLGILMAGALFSHLRADDPMSATIPALINMALLGTYFHILRGKMNTRRVFSPRGVQE